MPKLDPDMMRKRSQDSLLDTLGIEILDAGEGIAKGRMEIDRRHIAPNGYLHAASVIALADSTCGFGTYADLPEGAVGFTTAELKSNHIGTAREGIILCDAHAKHQGRTTQVWDAEVYREGERDKPFALFRCTQIVLKG